MSDSTQIFLIDSTIDVDRFLKSDNNFKIITFDYDSHKILLSHNITHEISDNYLNFDDLDTIQKNSYRISKWYEQTICKNIMQFSDVNLGELFYIELQKNLIPFLKKFIEIKNIYQKHPQSTFLASSSIYKIINSFTKSIIQLDGEIQKDPSFDFVEIPLRIGGKSFRFNIKKYNLSKIRQISDKFFNYSFGSEKRLKNTKNNILLVDFTTLRTSTIFSRLPKSACNIIKYDITIPSIWNFESYSIIKNSGCVITNRSILLDNNIKNSINDGILIVQQKIDMLLTNDEFFTTYFSINGVSVWEIFKETFTYLCKKHIRNAVEEIEITKKLFQKYSISSILIFSEADFSNIIIIKLAKKLGIPVITLQHGYYYDNQEYYEFNSFNRDLPLYSDKTLVWGEIMKNYYQSRGIPNEKIEVLGSPFFDEILNRESNNLQSSKDFILLATSSPITEIASDSTVRIRSDYETAIKQICEVVTKLNKKLVIKLHPSQYHGEDIIAKKINPTIKIVKAGSIIPLIQCCEVVIVIDVTTSILEAQILQKPVISVTVKDQSNPEIFSSKSCIRTDITNFENSLQKLLQDQNFKEQTIANGNMYVKNYLSNRGNAGESILRFLENYGLKR